MLSNPLSEDFGARLQRLAKRTGGAHPGRTVALPGFVINRKIVNTATSRCPANCTTFRFFTTNVDNQP